MGNLTSTGPTYSCEGEMWPRTDLIDLLGIIHPIIQAPMSGFGGPGLVAAVSNAGALGSLGCGALPTQTARDHIHEI
ncbi:MAG: nitronate monooxygenase, partial [Alphaproteobacteria bacterium]|nr:nitronate monooxygenase [Alphaproteobacteria bacterium]